jgi:hypothetical protein
VTDPSEPEKIQIQVTPRREMGNGIFGTMERIVDASKSPTAAPDDFLAEYHSRYHWRIVYCGGFFAVAGLLLGFALAAWTLYTNEKAVIMLGTPFLFGIGGFFFGMSLMCVIAPHDFLAGPAGRPWLKLIGTRSVTTARIVCFIFGLIVSLPFLAFGALLVMIATSQ